MTIDTRLTASLIALGLLAACGGGSPTSPGGGGSTPIVRDGGAGGTSGATVTLGSGASPATVTVAVGQTVTFINNSGRTREIASDPHPSHGTCPSIEAGLGSIGSGETKVTRIFANAGSCTYHDHRDDSNAAFKGRINVQ